MTDVHNTGKGYAFVTFEEKDAAENAIREMDGQTLNGQQIKVNEAKPREGGGRGGGRGRGGFGGGRGRGGGGYGGGGYGGGRGGYGGGGKTPFCCVPFYEYRLTFLFRRIRRRPWTRWWRIRWWT